MQLAAEDRNAEDLHIQEASEEVGHSGVPDAKRVAQGN
jgi:hypothetical protein